MINFFERSGANGKNVSNIAVEFVEYDDPLNVHNLVKTVILQHSRKAVDDQGTFEKVLDWMSK